MLSDYFLLYCALIIIILTWIVETSWFWKMIGLTKKKDIKSKKQDNRNWYGEKR